MGEFKMAGFISYLGWSLILHATTCAVEVQYLFLDEVSVFNFSSLTWWISEEIIPELTGNGVYTWVGKVTKVGGGQVGGPGGGAFAFPSLLTLIYVLLQCYVHIHIHIKFQGIPKISIPMAFE